MANEKEFEGMIKCVHKETGHMKWLPKNVFTDKSVSEHLDYTPLEIKKFESEEPIITSPQMDAREKAAKMEFDLTEKKRLWEKEMTEKEAQKKYDAETDPADPLQDKRHYTEIIKEINSSVDSEFVSSYLNDSRKSVRTAAEEKMKTFN